MLKLLRRLFCIPHRWECESCILTDEWYEVCSRCNKERRLKKKIGSAGE